MMQSKIQGVLWDLDGVIMDTGELHYQTWKETMDDQGFPFDREDFHRIFGMHNEEAVRLLLGDERGTRLWRQLSDRKESLFRDALHGQVDLLPGVRAWLEECSGLNIPCAIASSAPMENIDAIVDEADIRRLFRAIVSGVGHPGKPNPWVFQEAARQIGIGAEKCMVIEDSIAGVKAARAAGMYCLAVTTTNPADVLLQHGAHRVVDRLSDLRFEEL